ncbi:MULTISPECIES: hypothetical protein [Streptomyces]|uniref:hypothetical protein n=1 Tax=Streptomyces TaxID=1883 RepID=UPI0004CCCF99|nr:hypothetical protein [Streptomyces durhamensis]
MPLDPSALRLPDTVSVVAIDSRVLANSGQRPDSGRLESLAVPILATARATGVIVPLTEDQRIGDLLSPAEQLLGQRERLVDQVCSLRNQGRSVLVVSPRDGESLEHR